METHDLTSVCFEEWQSIRRNLSRLVRGKLEDGARLTKTKVIDNLMVETCDCSDLFTAALEDEDHAEAQRHFARGYILLRMVLSEIKFSKLEDRVLYNQINDSYLKLAFTFSFLKEVKDVVDIMSSQPSYSFQTHPALDFKQLKSPAASPRLKKSPANTHLREHAVVPPKLPPKVPSTNGHVYDMEPIAHTIPPLPDVRSKKPPVHAPPVPKVDMIRITTADLSSFLFSEQRQKIMVVDIRPRTDYKKAHINYKHTVNVDPVLLEECRDDAHLEERLHQQDPESHAVFYYREEYKFTVFFTADSKPSRSIDLFYTLMCSAQRSPQGKPILLSGGFSEWLKWYGDDEMKTKGEHHRKSMADRPFMPPPQYDLNTRNYSVSPEGRSTPIERAATPLRPPIPSIPPIPPIPNGLPPDTTQVYSQSNASTSSHHNYNYKALVACGLINNGSTCYINSMVQCLLNYAPLEELFQSRYADMLANQKGTGTLASAFHRLFQYMTTHPGAYFYPSEFLKRCATLNPSLGIPNDQQDTQEFLNFVLEKLNKELSFEQQVIRHYPEAVELYSPDPEYLKWFEAEIRLDGVSPVTGLFQGQAQSTLQCGRCGYKSSTYSRFNVLSVNMPDHSRAPVLALEECIEYYIADEYLSEAEGNAWNCPECEKLQKLVSTSKSPDKPKKTKRFFHKKEVSAEEPPVSAEAINHAKEVIAQENVSVRHTHFLHLPKLLVIHLARFGPMGTKLTYPISYPLVLDVPEGKRFVRYKLQSLIDHDGTLKSGHYTALVNKTHRLKTPFWCYCDDERITCPVAHGDYKNNIRRLESEKVYVLFYEKIEHL